MIDKKQARLRRARKTRAKIAELKSVRLSVHRTNCHIYAQVISSCGSKVLAAASPCPVYALGGISPANAAALIGSGACGIAGVDAVQTAVLA